MSLVTTCPACGVSFLIGPKQLDAHGGDVRCGKCGDVFNANDHLSEIGDSDVAVDKKESDPLSIEENIDESFPQDTAEPLMFISDASSESVTLSEDQAHGTDMEEDMLPEFSWAVPPSSKTATPTWVLWPFLLLLIALALGQSVYFLRTEIAVLLPQSRTLLDKACAVAGCTVKLPQQASLLNIDDTDLQEDPEHQGVYILSCNLINRAAFPQAYPLLELTLTDLYGKPALRRTLTPEEYLPKEIKPETGLAAFGEARLKILFNANNVKATGYRIFVTYS
jgi:predicted Zn finger-like uncharacterized protein